MAKSIWQTIINQWIQGYVPHVQSNQSCFKKIQKNISKYIYIYIYIYIHRLPEWRDTLKDLDSQCTDITHDHPWTSQTQVSLEIMQPYWLLLSTPLYDTYPPVIQHNYWTWPSRLIVSFPIKNGGSCPKPYQQNVKVYQRVYHHFSMVFPMELSHVSMGFPMITRWYRL